MNIYQFLSIVTILIILNFSWNALFHSEKENSNQDKPYIETEEKSNTTFKLIFSLIALFPLLMGLWAINHWLSEYNIANESVSWEQLPGKILSKDIHYQKQVGQSSTQTAGKTYAPEVEYEFYYKDKTIKWNVIDFHNRTSSGDTDDSQIVLDKIPEVGENVTVYFSAKHKKAVLIPGTKGTKYFGIIAGSLFFILGLIAIKLIYKF